jgi:hypothetical protein
MTQPVNAEDMQWDSITLTKLSRNTYHALFENVFTKGESEIEVSEEDLAALGPDPPLNTFMGQLGDHWHTVAQMIRDRFRCPVYVVMPEGSDPPQVCFLYSEAQHEKAGQSDCSPGEGQDHGRRPDHRPDTEAAGSGPAAG